MQQQTLTNNEESLCEQHMSRLFYETVSQNNYPTSFF